MIEGTFYTDETDHFYNRVYEGRTYLIAKAEISAANKKFTAIKHDYRLIFKVESIIEEVGDEERPSVAPGVNGPIKLNLTEIEDILQSEGDELFTVEVYGKVGSTVTRDSMDVKHSSSNFKGRT